MCGITGIYWFDPERSVDGRVLDAMTDALAHRGPDGRGTFIDGPLGLGHRRLAIIDLSPNAAQPLANEDGSVRVVCNGEIYNFRELRRELVEKGHRFQSQSDNEVLVHLYEEMGDRLVERLRGMFAFALWDGRGRRLLLARDRFGQKPCYYRLTGKGLHFASEIKGILQDPGVSREPDLGALDAYLTYGYVPAPRTAFGGIRKLPPAHTLAVEADGRHRLHRYWRLRFAPKLDTDPAGGKERAAERFLELLDEATRLRMISDVPLGALLSGGIDSSAIVASMCASSGGERPRTFTIGFRERSFDESRYAAAVAGHLETDHHRLELSPDSVTGLERIAWHYGEPFADPSCLPTFAVAALARRHVTVALTGDGGDELLCGYRRYSAMRLERWLRGAARPLAPALRSRPTVSLLRRARRKALAGYLERSRRHRRDTPARLYLAYLEMASPELKRSLYAGDSLHAIGSDAAYASLAETLDTSDGEELAERCSHTDALTYLPDDILTKVDVASMAHALECRAPLLDHVLAEYVAALPFRLKMSRLRGKVVLRQAVERRLPAAILERGKKGFNVPLRTWFQEGEFLQETLLSARAAERGYFRPAAVRQLVDEHLAGSANHQRALFTLLMLEIWHRQWIDPARLDLGAPG